MGNSPIKFDRIIKINLLDNIDSIIGNLNERTQMCHPTEEQMFKVDAAVNVIANTIIELKADED